MENILLQLNGIQWEFANVNFCVQVFYDNTLHIVMMDINDDNNFIRWKQLNYI